MATVKKFFKFTFGYCAHCNKWFRFPKRRRQNTAYLKEELNYVCVCKGCFEEIEKYWTEMWEDYYASR